MTAPPVVVVGDVCTDVVVLLAGAPAPGSDRPASIVTRGGGAGANVAAHLAALGTPVLFAGCVGTDVAGESLCRELAAAGVDLAVRAVDAASTGTIISLVEPGGERSMLADRGANLALRPADVPAPAPGGHLHLSGYTLLDAAPRAAGLAALAAAQLAGCTTSVDPASTGPLTGYGVDRWLSDTATVTLLLPNAAEARLLTGCADPEAAARELAARYPVVVVSLGADGALWAAGELLVHRPAHAVTVVDTTGAGDALTAGVLAAWTAASGAPDPAAALEAGLAWAATVVGRPGAR
ncbi:MULTISPECIES: carbohydrate kinase family protein [unclassified Modestobacter]|uniref:carbohydrate kinase family protein n=1 Tax=unclassified Modestobacter TaxID=2643866 RepID=UPI0022A9F915|nr:MULTISPECIES: PfkB family carbohydrate kinase [unclassified Modestobacter]MCZ2827203.1 PfkB family carbohydrate kinase [Modestobacter sp. VKM Ac-2981]MCZ2854889.1 PfkB family carbohydrate kinase [Modestobacter sp. VKM Ac-2982]